MDADDLDQLVYWFDLRGYAVIRGALSPDRVERLNLLFDERLEVPGADLDQQVFSGFLGWAPDLLDLVDHRRVMPLLRALVGDRMRLDRYYGLQMRPGTRGVPLHGGAADTVEGPEYYRFDGGRPRNGIVTVSWALNRSDASSGGFACIPGSHKSNVPRPATVTEAETEVVALSAGDALVFTSAIAHCGTLWTGPGTRRVLLFKYAPPHVAWSRCYEQWPSDVIASLTEEQRPLFEPPSILGASRIGIGTR